MLKSFQRLSAITKLNVSSSDSIDGNMLINMMKNRTEFKMPQIEHRKINYDTEDDGSKLWCIVGSLDRLISERESYKFNDLTIIKCHAASHKREAVAYSEADSDYGVQRHIQSTGWQYFCNFLAGYCNNNNLRLYHDQKELEISTNIPSFMKIGWSASENITFNQNSIEDKVKLNSLLNCFLRNKARLLQETALSGHDLAKMKCTSDRYDDEHIFWRHLRKMSKEDIDAVAKRTGNINKYGLYVNENEVVVHWGNKL